jgi:hypothetical protein
VSSATVALSSDVLVRQWVDAFNARDLDGMLARLDPEVRLHPLRLRGLDGSYRSRDGVQRWFARLTQLRHEHVIILSDVHGSQDDQVLAVGSLRLVGNFEIAPFCAVYRIAGGLIAAAHHCLSDPDMLEHLGLIP